MAKHTIVQKELDRYLTDKEKNKDKPTLTFDESKAILFDYCDENGKVPPQRTKHQNINIGGWLKNQKEKSIPPQTISTRSWQNTQSSKKS